MIYVINLERHPDLPFAGLYGPFEGPAEARRWAEENLADFRVAYPQEPI